MVSLGQQVVQSGLGLVLVFTLGVTGALSLFETRKKSDKVQKGILVTFSTLILLSVVWMLVSST